MEVYGLLISFATDDDFGFDFIPEKMHKNDESYVLEPVEFNSISEAKEESVKILKGLRNNLRAINYRVFAEISAFLTKAIYWIGLKDEFDYEDYISGNYEGTEIVFYRREK